MLLLLAVAVVGFVSGGVSAQNIEPMRFDFGDRTVQTGYLGINTTDPYRADRGYGFEPGHERLVMSGRPSDVATADAIVSNSAFRFSVRLPEGTYRVRLEVGGPAGAIDTTIKSESRQLIAEHLDTEPGQTREVAFLVNIRTPKIDDRSVRLTPREPGALHWDDKLTIEFNGERPAVAAITIEPAPDATVVYLIGDSTVTDQQHEPYCGWGQMLPVFFDGTVAVANHAESGRSVRSFLGERRFDKIMQTLKRGDYVLIQFGHNDMKEKGEGIGAFESYTDGLRQMINAIRERGAHPVLVTSMHRRSFNNDGTIRDTLEAYPVAMRRLAEQDAVPLIDLHAMSALFYQAMGPADSARAFVHYPADTFPNQPEPLRDNTHHNAYGAYVLARCVVEGVREAAPRLAEHLAVGLPGFDPARPPAFDAVRVPMSPPPPSVTRPEGD